MAEKRGGILPMLFMIAVLAASCAVGGYYLYINSRSNSRLSGNGFDVAKVDAAPAAAPSAYKSNQPTASPMPISGMPGFNAPPQETQNGIGPGVFKAGAPQSAAPAAPSASSAAERAREKEFLTKHGAELQNYEEKVLGNITRKYQKNNQIVRDVDHAFGAMPRYMAIKNRYGKDKDPFGFARDAIALPEVRAEIAKRMADPAVWKAALGMITEAMRNPPPKAIYDEAKHFMQKEDAVAEYVSGEGADNARKNMGAITGAMGPDTDMSGLQKLAADIAPGAAGGGMAGAMGAMGQKP